MGSHEVCVFIFLEDMVFYRYSGRLGGFWMTATDLFQLSSCVTRLSFRLCRNSKLSIENKSRKTLRNPSSCSGRLDFVMRLNAGIGTALPSSLHSDSDNSIGFRDPITLIVVVA